MRRDGADHCIIAACSLSHKCGIFRYLSHQNSKLSHKNVIAEVNPRERTHLQIILTHGQTFQVKTEHILRTGNNFLKISFFLSPRHMVVLYRGSCKALHYPIKWVCSKFLHFIHLHLALPAINFYNGLAYTIYKKPRQTLRNEKKKIKLKSYLQCFSVGLEHFNKHEKLGWFLNEKFYRNNKLFHIKLSRYVERNRDNWI